MLLKDLGEEELIGVIEQILGKLGNPPLEGQDDAVSFDLNDSDAAVLDFFKHTKLAGLPNGVNNISELLEFLQDKQSVMEQNNDQNNEAAKKDRLNIYGNSYFKDPIIVANTDMLVSTTDIPPKMTLMQAGRKAVVMAVSDLLVKGAIPKWGLVSIGVPGILPLEENYGFKAIIRGIKKGFDLFNMSYLGGDLNETKEIIISVTIFGIADRDKVIRRAGARPGDIIVSTGKFGDTGCGFSILIEKVKDLLLDRDIEDSFIKAVVEPNTPQEYGPILSFHNWATASADSSDGVIKTINVICRSSKVDAVLKEEWLPIHKGVLDFCDHTGKDLWDVLFNAGEEFLHIFTIRADQYEIVKQFFSKLNKPLYKIGIIVPKHDDQKVNITLELKEGSKLDLSDYFSGYNHFKE
ncbi:MAG: thiamine-phosphate kinase [Promethearchaeota archaeon]